MDWVVAAALALFTAGCAVAGLAIGLGVVEGAKALWRVWRDGD